MSKLLTCSGCGEYVGSELSDYISKLETQIDQMHGLADEGISVPSVAYRWCERIDEVATLGPQEEYVNYSMTVKQKAKGERE